MRECAVLPASRKVASQRAHFSLQHGQRDHPYAWFFAAARLGISAAVRLRRARAAHEDAGR